jgi:hypothetical protein
MFCELIIQFGVKRKSLLVMRARIFLMVYEQDGTAKLLEKSAGNPPGRLPTARETAVITAGAGAPAVGK